MHLKRSFELTATHTRTGISNGEIADRLRFIH